MPDEEKSYDVDLQAQKYFCSDGKTPITDVDSDYTPLCDNRMVKLIVTFLLIKFLSIVRLYIFNCPILNAYLK
jgi:hypothetical protein